MLTPIRLGETTESAYRQLNVPDQFAEPCFVNEARGMLVHCRIGESTLTAKPVRYLRFDALPMPVESIELIALSETGVVVGYQTSHHVPAGAPFDSVRRAVGLGLQRLWRAPSDSIGDCWLWRNRADSVPWTATFCHNAGRRAIHVLVAPTDADDARGYLSRSGHRLPQPLDPGRMPRGQTPWWSPVWRPLALLGMEPGREVGRVLRTANLAIDRGICRRPSPALRADTTRRECSWRDPGLTVAGLSASLLRVDMEPSIQMQRYDPPGSLRATELMLQFSPFIRTKAEVGAECRRVVAALIEEWGHPIESEMTDDRCLVEWERMPFQASAHAIYDDGVTRENSWALQVSWSVFSAAVPPTAWQRWD